MGHPAPTSNLESLLDRDSRADALKDSLRLFRGLLVDLLQDWLRCAVHQVLGLLEAKPGQRPHLLDDLDLLVARSLEDDVELVLLLGCLGGLAAATGRASGRHRDRSGRLDVEGLLELLHELGELDQRHLLKRVKEVSGAELRHGSCSSSCFLWLSSLPALVRASRRWSWVLLACRFLGRLAACIARLR